MHSINEFVDKETKLEELPEVPDLPESLKFTPSDDKALLDKNEDPLDIEKRIEAQI